ncbi:hypothetical protein [Clostridium sp.]|uniref:hypothetical protein n=1 Tax=Clostridium sp. TaxID=1506 RepID=UPI00261F1573|nr:hypothetical protein [Clostridium sp.]
MLEAIKTKRKSGSENFKEIKDATLRDYWSWAHSDLIGNAERGILAEYIISMALDVHHGTRTEWDSYDILSKDGIKIEVKSSGYIQTWVQKDYSSLKFGIQPTKEWNQEDNTYSDVIKRQSDIYVFCVHKHKEQDTINPLDLEQITSYLSKRELLQKDIVFYPDLSSKGAIFFTTPLLEKIFLIELKSNTRWKGGRSIFYWIENRSSSIKLRCEMCSDGLTNEEIKKHENFASLATGQEKTNWKQYQRIKTWDVFSFKNNQWFDINNEDLEPFQNQLIEKIKNIIDIDIKAFESNISLDELINN